MYEKCPVVSICSTTGHLEFGRHWSLFTICHAFDQRFQCGVAGGIRRRAVIARRFRVHVLRRRGRDVVIDGEDLRRDAGGVGEAFGHVGGAFQTLCEMNRVEIDNGIGKLLPMAFFRIFHFVKSWESDG